MWYVIQIPSGKEEQVKQLCLKQLDKMSYTDIFIPMREVKKRYNGEWHVVLERLFPGYIFIESDNILRVKDKLLDITFSTKVLGTGDEICSVTETEKKFLVNIMDKAYIVRESVGFIIGDKVRIIEGPLSNISGDIKHIDRHKRKAVLRVDMFGGVNSMTVSLEIVKKINCC